MEIKLGEKNKVFYLDEVSSISNKDCLITSLEGVEFQVSCLQLSCFSHLIKEVMLEFFKCNCKDEKFLVITEIPTVHLEQIISFFEDGILTCHSTIYDLHNDQPLISSFFAAGINLKEYHLENSEKVFDESGLHSILELSFKDEPMTSHSDYEDESRTDGIEFVDVQDKTLQKYEKEDEPLKIPPNPPKKSLRSRKIATRSKPKKKSHESKSAKTQVKRLKCPHCDKSYSHRRDFDLHVLRHESDNSWTCVRCKDQKFKIRNDLMSHIKTSHRDDVYTCLHCPKSFKGLSYGHYRRHLETHEKRMSKSKLTCTSCGFKTDSQKQLQSHQQMKGVYHDDTCATCDRKMKSWDEYQEHVKKEHDGTMKFRCGKCKEVFLTNGDVRSHRLQKHSAKTKSICEECGEEVSNMVNHTRKYHGTEEHQCPLCPAVLKHELVLRYHMLKSHTNLQCEECGKVMPNKTKYKLHMDSKHTPDHLKPYQCQICPNKGFAHLGALREHNNIHTNERPHKCSHCNMGFNSRANMFNHLKKCKTKARN